MSLITLVKVAAVRALLAAARRPIKVAEEEATDVVYVWNRSSSDPVKLSLSGAFRLH